MLLSNSNVLFVLIDSNLGRRDRRERLLIIKMVNVCHVIRFGLIMKMVLDVLVFRLWTKRLYFIRWFLLKRPGMAPIPEMFRVRI